MHDPAFERLRFVGLEGGWDVSIWLVRRIWSWRYKRWRNVGWRRLPRSKLYGELGLVNLLKLIPSMEAYYRQQRYSR